VAAGLSLYPLLSAYFLRRPQQRLIHPPLPPSLQVRFSAHRGGAAERPENSMAAFAHSVSLGVDLLELDVHLTSDGQVVVYHDPTVDRLAPQGITGAVGNFSYANLPPIRRDGAPLPPPFNPPGSTLSWRPAASASAAELRDAFTPPLLSDVFLRFPHACMNIDLKHGSQELVEKVASLIEKYNRSDRTLWGSSVDSVARQCYERNPNIPMFASARAIGVLLLQYVTGWLPFAPMHQRAVELPLFTAQARERMRQHHLGGVNSQGDLKFSTRVALSAFSLVATSPALIQHLQARNIKVIFWVLNDEKEFEEALDKHGADSIMTDYPSRLGEFIRRRDAAAATAASTTGAAAPQQQQQQQQQQNGKAAKSASATHSKQH
jgi:glycerophosphoryl diester phosphodiesterase